MIEKTVNKKIITNFIYLTNIQLFIHTHTHKVEAIFPKTILFMFKTHSSFGNKL